jgi:hypothetical protein
MKCSFPVAGKIIRRMACRKLAKNPTSQVIPYLIEALSSPDMKVHDVSLAALNHIADQGAIDSLCSIWFEKRDETLEEIIIRNKYVAKAPPGVRVYSALKAGIPEISVEAAGNISYTLSALSDNNISIERAAKEALNHITDSGAIDALCYIWFDKRDETLEKIILQNKYVARTPPDVRVYSALKSGLSDISVERGCNISYVLSALEDKDMSIVEAAKKALNNITEQGAIDALCSIWYEKRDETLGKIILQNKYVARTPPDVRVYSALKSGLSDISVEEGDNISYVLSALKDKDISIACAAKEALNHIKIPEAIDVLCNCFIKNPSDILLSIIREQDYQPKDIRQRCVLYILTGQIDRYFDLDFESQYLRAEYHSGDENLRRRIGDAILKTGDARLLSIFKPTVKKKLASDLTEKEAKIVIDVNARNRRWDDIFAFLFQVSLVNGIYALDILKNSGWRPNDGISAALFDELLEMRSGMDCMPAKSPDPGAVIGSVLAEWILKGQGEDFMLLSDEDLHGLLHKAPPPVSVAALSAISRRGKADSNVIDIARTHKDWLVRLASLHLCDLAPQFAFSDTPLSEEGGMLWIKRIGPCILDSLIHRKGSVKLTPEQLKTLQSVLKGKKKKGPYAWGGLYEILARRYLRHTIEIDEKMTITITRTAIEIEEKNNSKIDSH